MKFQQFCFIQQKGLDAAGSPRCELPAFTRQFTKLVGRSLLNGQPAQHDVVALPNAKVAKAPNGSMASRMNLASLDPNFWKQFLDLSPHHRNCELAARLGI
jgi:hypothetical protein